MSKAKSVMAISPEPNALPPLLIQLFKDGKPTRIVGVADPREAYCVEYAKQAARWGESARPIVGDEVPAARRRLKRQQARKAVDHV